MSQEMWDTFDELVRMDDARQRPEGKRSAYESVRNAFNLLTSNYTLQQYCPQNQGSISMLTLLIAAGLDHGVAQQLMGRENADQWRALNNQMLIAYNTEIARRSKDARRLTDNLCSIP